MTENEDNKIMLVSVVLFKDYVIVNVRHVRIVGNVMKELWKQLQDKALRALPYLLRNIACDLYVHIH